FRVFVPNAGAGTRWRYSPRLHQQARAHSLCPVRPELASRGLLIMAASLPIHGVIVPMLTPFTPAGALDLAAIGPLVDFLIERGVAGLFPLGTTGEGPLMTLDERFQAAEATVQATAGRVPVIIHTGAISTGETIELTR